MEDEIAKRLGSSLHHLPVMVRAPTRRVYLSTEVAKMVNRAFEDSEDAVRYAESRALLDHFASDRRVALGWKPLDKRHTAALARIDPEGHPNQYVFDFRSTDEVAGIRVFGCFARRDWFVGIRWDFRENVDWPSAAQRCHEAWISIFDAPPPNLGRNQNDYLSGNYLLV